MFVYREKLLLFDEASPMILKKCGVFLSLKNKQNILKFGLASKEERKLSKKLAV